MTYFCISTAGGDNFADLNLPKCDFYGKSPRKELNFENFRVAGAPILEFFDHNPNFVKKGGIRPPPIFRADLAGFGQKGGGRILLIVLIGTR